MINRQMITQKIHTAGFAASPVFTEGSGSTIGVGVAEGIGVVDGVGIIVI